MFVIEDERHAEIHGQFESREEAIAELRRRAKISWDSPPNLAPCTNWRNCGRTYEVVDYDTTQTPWVERRRLPALDISADGVKWDKALHIDDAGSEA